MGGAILSPHRSTVSIPRDSLQNGKIADCILSLEHNETCSFLLYVGAREVNNGVETAVKLFLAGTSFDTMENIQMTFRPPSFYWDECHPFSLVVSKGYRFDPLPPKFDPSIIYLQREYGSNTIFSVSLYIGQEGAEREIKEIAKSESEEASDSESENTSDSEIDIDMS